MKKQYRKRGAKYTISPYSLVYSDENYYLNGQKIHHDQLAEAISDILERSIGEAVKNIKIKI